MVSGLWFWGYRVAVFGFLYGRKDEIAAIMLFRDYSSKGNSASIHDIVGFLV